ncbi:tetratricopeptide repeat protein [Nostoc favosum]|uniref:Uncharacterized protein n=1 Tax=Nostoc favosum CHAB5714 TaxID=2780399 RepID=A0ABS8III5_9NOSO|nr:hypothetical protein [Nostoc favosum]MCC5604103.1 hypothetical protein [Nostoc favosum CHAB5714]
MKRKFLPIIGLLFTIGLICAVVNHILGGICLFPDIAYNPSEGQSIKARTLAIVAVPYAEIGQKDKSSKILAQAFKNAEEIKETNTFSGRRSSALLQVATKYGEVGQPAQALQVIKIAKEGAEHGSGAAQMLNEAAVKAAEAGRFNQAIQVTQLLDNKAIGYFENRDSAIAEVAVEAAQVGLYDQAFQLLSSIDENTDKTGEALTKIAELATSTKLRSKALPLLDQTFELANRIKNVSALAKVASQYTELGQKAKSEQILNRCLQLTQSDKYISDQVENIVKIAVSYANIGQQDKAVEILDSSFGAVQLIQINNIPKPILSEIAIGYAKLGQKNKPLQIPILFKIAIGYAKIGQKNKALQILNQAFQQIKTNEYAWKTEQFSQIAVKYEEIGFHQQALEAAKMLGAPERVRALVAVAVEDAEQSQYDLAIKNIKSIGNHYPHEVRPDKMNGLSQIAMKAASAGQYEQAFKIIESIDDDFCGDCIAKPLIKLVNKATRTETKDQASQLLHKALSIAQFNILNQPERVGVLAEVANHYAQLGQQQKASEILAQALKTGEDITIVKRMPENMSVIFTRFKYPCPHIR